MAGADEQKAPPVKMSRSVIAAIVIFVVLLGYFGVRTLLRGGEAPGAEAAAEETRPETPVARVSVLNAQMHPVHVSLKGRTEPDRIVTVKAETSGRVAEASAVEGAFVERGAVLCGLSLEARQARLTEARAAVDAQQIEYNAAKQLVEKGWTSENSEAAAKAALDAAEAALNAAQVEINRTRVRAPFDGVFETRLAEAGDYLGPGAACGVLVDLDPLVAVVDVSADVAQSLAKGMSADITLPNGETRPGAVRYVSRTSDNATRTYRVEVETPNPDYALTAGVSVSITARVAEAPAVQLSPALLVLDDTGDVGVRHVDGADTVRFSRVTVIDDAGDGVWVTGLPDPVSVLTAGQDFLREGVVVDTAAPEET